MTDNIKRSGPTIGERLEKREESATEYTLIHLADDEWDNQIMESVARQHFDEHPDCQFILVYEHAGWALGFRRDMSIWSTSNDCARLDGGPRPSICGDTIRRQTKAHQAEPVST